ncbi:unnamed protein product, partial [Thlaspi arvense]
KRRVYSRNVALRMMMEGFCSKLRIEMSILRFHFDGKRIRPDQTPNELGLEDEDEIDAFFDQYGGCSLCYRYYQCLKNH